MENLNIPSLTLDNLSAFLMGKDRVGWLYQAQLTFAVRELAMRHRPSSSDATADAQVLGRVTNSAFWGLYCITMYGQVGWHTTDDRLWTPRAVNLLKVTMMAVTCGILTHYKGIVTGGIPRVTLTVFAT